MTHSESIAAIAAALVEAQGKMDGVRKTSINPAFRSKYADLAAVVDAVVPELQAAGIAVIQGASSSHDEHGYVVNVETMFVHKSGEWMKSELGLRPTKSDPQGAGSAITYGRRYLLLAMAGVAPEDDDGNGASGRPPQGNNAPRTQAAPAPAPAPAPVPAPAASEGDAAAALKKRLDMLLENPILTPVEVTRCISNATNGKAFDKDGIKTAGQAKAVVKALEDAIKEAGEEVPF